MNEKYTVDHIGIWTTNAESLIKFYTRVLGFKFLSSQRLEDYLVKKIFDVNTSCCFYRLKSPNLIIEIFEPHKKKNRKMKTTPGYHHFGLVVKNREVFIKYARSKKAKIIKVKRNGHFVYFIKDTDGNMIELRRRNDYDKKKL
ncbi:MAG: VOC family protein [bacterium]